MQKAKKVSQGQEKSLTVGYKMKNTILADGRWQGLNGIGRFSHEVLSRLKETDICYEGPKPLSLKNLWWHPRWLKKQSSRYNIFFTPGFNPVFTTDLPYVITIADLIHLYAPGHPHILKKLFYHQWIKPSIKNAYKVITVSEYSKKTIMSWTNISAENIITVGCGVSLAMSAQGNTFNPGYPYLLHVGNTKPHKNVSRLFRAFALAKLPVDMKLILTGQITDELNTIIREYHLANRIIATPPLSETQLAEYYRGAHAVVFPSLYEGFGLPVIEGMASGTPVLTSTVTSLPEVAGDAALLVDPYALEAMIHGLECIVYDETLRANLIHKGLLRAKTFTWEKTSAKIQNVLVKL